MAMLFFGGRYKKSSEREEKNSSDSLQLQSIIEMLQTQADKMKQKESSETVEREAWQERQKQLDKRLRKQENMLEDLLEQIEEERDEFQKLKESMAKEQEKQQYMLENQNMKQILQEQKAEGVHREKKLLEIIAAYDEYLHRISSAPSASQEENSRQKALIFQVLDQSLAEGGVKRIDGSGQSVDFDAMTVLQVFETEQADRENTVKETVLPGWIYKGTVVQKAKVTAYRRKE